MWFEKARFVEECLQDGVTKLKIFSIFGHRKGVSNDWNEW